MVNIKKSKETRAVRTTILTIDREKIDWESFRDRCHILRYKMPFYNRKTDKNYFARMHNWYKQESDFPCYLNSHDSYLYVNYGNLDEVVSLSYEGRPLKAEVVNLSDEAMLPWIIKLLVSDFFQFDGRFVSNAKAVLWATAAKDFVSGLAIDLNHNWKENKDEFIVSDKAVRLRKLRPIDFEKIQSWRQIYYGRFYATPETPVFKQLKKDQLTREQLSEGIYVLYEGKSNDRASLTFHSTESLSALQHTRSFLLNRFIDQFVDYLNKLGLPFRQKQLQMKPVHTISAAKMTERQLPLEKKPIYMVDDRINATRRPDDFAARLCEVANDATPDHTSLFVLKKQDELQRGDWVLRLQDYTGEEFDPETGILKVWQDTKAAFYDRHADVVKQTLTVNQNSKSLQSDAQRKKPRSWTAEEYLEYPVPTVEDLRTELEVCRNQLILKDVIMFPQNVLSRFPQAKLMGSVIFLYNQALVHFDGKSLHFMPVANNLDQASEYVQKHTGWNLLNDVLLPSAEKYYFNYTNDPSAIDNTTKRPFLISPEFVWEIWEGNGRVLNEDMEIQRRLEAFEKPRPIRDFYPVPSEGAPFETAQQEEYKAFLVREVRQAVISFTDLVKQYGSHLRDERGNVLQENGGFFNILGISNVRKFREYLRNYVGLPLDSARESSLFPVYKGIWYTPDTHHYVAGVKETNREKQERYHVLRRIVVHRGNQEPNALDEQIAQSFIPLLEVNFIRYKNYTVIPFPFRLIEMWLNLGLE